MSLVSSRDDDLNLLNIKPQKIITIEFLYLCEFRPSTLIFKNKGFGF